MDARSLGVVVGFIVGIVLVMFIFKFINRNGKVKTEYDELQKINRAKAIKMGFSVSMMYVAVLVMISAIGIQIPAQEPVVLFSIIFVAVLAVATTSIWNGSYYGMTTNITRFWAIMIVVTVINILVPLISLSEGELIVDGKLGLSGINLLCGILFLIIGIEALVNLAISKRAGDNDEES